MTKLFVSYRREDSPYVAAAINERLEQRWGTDSVFFDIDSIPLGSDFREHISNSVGKCDVLLVVIGDNWTTVTNDRGERRLDDPSDFVRLEVESALARGIPVIPVLVDEASIPSTNDLPASLQDLSFRNATEVRAGRDLKQHLDRLVQGIESLFQSRQGERGHEIDASQHPRVIDLNAKRVPGPSPSQSASPIREDGVRRGSWKRLVIASLTFVFFLRAGYDVGDLIESLSGGNDSLGLMGAVLIWTAGLVLTFWVWRRYRRAWKRLVITSLTFGYFFYAGWLVAIAIYSFTPSDLLAIMGAVATWIIGLVLTFWLWRRYKRA